MTELSRNLIAAARDGLAPDAAVAARVRAKIAATVSAGAVASTTTAGPATAAPPLAAPAGGLALKLAAMLLAAGAIAAIVVASSERSPADAPRIETASVEPDASSAAFQMRSAESLVPASPSAAAAQPTQHAPTPNTRRASKHAHVKAPGRAPATLAREVELLDRAMLLLRKGAAAAALDAVAAFERETHGRGQLAEDAAAVEIEARCRLRQDVTARLAAFDRRWPSSVQRERLQRACFAL